MGRKFALIAALIGVWTLPAHAQSRAGAHAVASPSAVSTRPVRSIPAPIRPLPVRSPVATSNPGLTAASFSAGGLQNLLGCPAAGFNSDLSNWAALNGNLAVRGLIDPATQYEIAQAVRQCGVNVGAPAFFYPPFGPAPIAMEIETPMAAVPAVPADPAPEPPQIAVAPPAEEPPPPDPPAAQEMPLPDPGEFVLVQRDGRLLFAAGFTAASGHVVYVTKEGVRRSISLDQLDVDATLRMNEERGSSIQLPRA